MASKRMMAKPHEHLERISMVYQPDKVVRVAECLVCHKILGVSETPLHPQVDAADPDVVRCRCELEGFQAREAKRAQRSQELCRERLERLGLADENVMRHPWQRRIVDSIVAECKQLVWKGVVA